MPPKIKPNKKEDQKRKEKIIEDKTFGMKNKKGNKQQKYIQTVTKQINHDISKKRTDTQNAPKVKLDQQELRLYFNPLVEIPKVDSDVDPKTIMCPFFKQGICSKGKKCKYSHALQEGVRKNVYVDSRVDKTAETTDITEIICRYFLEAVENDLFGWRWVCVNGDNCHYRHCLPQGYILKKDRKLMEEKEASMSIEEYIESGRSKLVGELTPVTAITFTEWKRKRLMTLKEKKIEDKRQRSNTTSQGLGDGATGREVFESKGDDQMEDVEDKNQVIVLPLDDKLEEDDCFEVDESLFLMEGLDEELSNFDI